MRPFTLIKFRTMGAAPAGAAITIGADPRITRFGRWLRSSHLDELPQLLTILLGRMSFIGPRPEIPEFIDPRDPLHREVCSVRPGLFDTATLAWLDEAHILAQTTDWREHYRQVILPDKLTRSRAYLSSRSIVSDVFLTFQMLAALLGADGPRKPEASRGNDGGRFSADPPEREGLETPSGDDAERPDTRHAARSRWVDNESPDLRDSPDSPS